MFKKFATFWIEHAKLTWLFIITTLGIGVFTWLTIPKQYNPDIVVPAFQITVQAPGYASQQAQQLVTKPLENILAGLEGVDHIYGYSADNLSSVMVAFRVGVDKEKATTRVHNAITANQSRTPLGVENRTIQSIDPDDIPIVSFAVYASGVDMATHQQQNVLRTIALELIDQLKTVPNSSVWYHQGGQAEQITIQLDIDALQTKQVDILQLINAVQSQQLNTAIGSVKLGDTQAIINLAGAQDNIQNLQQLIVATYAGRPVYLQDVASITQGQQYFQPATWFANSTDSYESVFVGVAKTKGSNAATVARAIDKKLETVEATLPDGYYIERIQDEGVIAAKTTNMLLINLTQSILIVLIVLSLFLGRTRALNVAITIPMTLSIVFLFILLIGDNINRITLFALILVLGMLVDDATVVVENVSRHLAMRDKTYKTIKQAILDAISEVELGVVLSTITRLLAFIAMFFVTGMMGDYMGPIPKYAIITMISSTIIALSINPFLAYTFEQRKQFGGKNTKIAHPYLDLLTKKRNQIEQVVATHRHTFGQRYQARLKTYLTPENKFLRKKFKRSFRIILGIIVIAPIYGEIFKARMLPKSDQQQIYLWLDLSRDSHVDHTKEVVTDIQQFLESYYRENTTSTIKRRQRIIQETSRRIGTAPMLDFSNLFRGSQSRGLPYQVSARINLTEQSSRSMSSETFVFALRTAIDQYLAQHYPDVEMRLLEDPPGPPTRATFLLEVTSNEMAYETLIDETKRLYQKLLPQLDAYQVKDVGISDDGWQTEYTVTIDHQLLAQAGLTAKQVGTTLQTLYHGIDLALIYDDTHLEPITINIQANPQQIGSEQAFSKILLTNAQDQRIPLTEVATISQKGHNQVIYSDDRVQAVYLYGEMGNNSVVYPVVGLYKMFKRDGFRESRYEFVGSDFYGFDLRHKLSGQHVRINLGGERELTMDTFRDMGLAMIIAFIAIYIMMVVQFGTFSLAGVIMISFLLGFFGVFPGYALLYIVSGEYFSATSMIGVIALAGIVVGNAILLIEYVMILLKQGNTVKMSLINAGWTRMKPILITSLTTILGATTILGDPVWSGVARAIILGLTSSALLTTIVLPIFLYDTLREQQNQYDSENNHITAQT